MNKRRQLLWFGSLLFTLVLTLCPLTLVVGIALGSFWKDYDPASYEVSVGSHLGVSDRVTYNVDLSDPKTQEIVKTSDLDPDEVAYAIAAIKWIETDVDPGAKLDLGMALAIYSGESGAGANLGHSDSKAAVCTSDRSAQFCSSEKEAIDWLLAHWQEYQIAAKNPVAGKMIYPDYSNYTGHSVGEAGYDGILPTTGVIICKNGLMQNKDPEVASCDYWSKKTSTFAKMWWLWKIGYRAELTDEEKFKELFGWNQDEPYRNRLIEASHKYNALFDGVDLSVTTEQTPVVKFEGDYKWLVIGLLSDFGLIPSSVPGHLGSQEWLKVPVDKDHGITQQYNPEGLSDESKKFYGVKHYGIDFGCAIGSKILAAADGYIVNPTDPHFKNDDMDGDDHDIYGWGIVLFIDHGNGIYSVYMHMNETLVQYGQWVTKGTPIGVCGYTGWTRPDNLAASTHLHFSVIYSDVAPVAPASLSHFKWLDPNNFVGKSVDPASAVSTSTDTTK